MAGFAAASLAIRSCFVDTLSGFKAPSVFLKSDSVLRCPASLGWVRLSRVPQRLKYYQSTTTSCTEYGVTYIFASPLQPILSSFAPVRRRSPHRPGPVQARYRWLLSAGQTQDLPGSWRIHPISLPRSQIPAGSSVLTLSARQCCPQLTHGEGTSKKGMSRFNHAA